MDDSKNYLIARLREHLSGRINTVDMTTSTVLPGPPLSPSELAESEERLGFSLPSPLRTIYQEVANGGFGPGYGLLPLETAVSSYLDSRRDDPGAKVCQWPEGLLPLCEWGCGISSSVDCTTRHLAVVRCDENKDLGDLDFDLAENPYQALSEEWLAAWPESPSLASWLEDWINGLPLFDLGYPGSWLCPSDMVEYEPISVRALQDHRQNWRRYQEQARQFCEEWMAGNHRSGR